MQAAREFRGFQPVGEEMQFKRGETDRGFAKEGELIRRSEINNGRRRAEPREKHAQTIQAGRIQRHLRAPGNLARGLTEIKNGIDARPGDFPIIIDQIGPA